jgi:phosphonoacetate hydrolase
VPLIVTRPVSGLAAGRRYRNFDAFDIGLNHAR